MNTELRNINGLATTVDSHASRVENEPPAFVHQLESEDATLDSNKTSTEHSECQSVRNCSLEHSECNLQLNSSPEQQNTKKVNDKSKESLADWGVVACVFLSNLIAAIDFSMLSVLYPHLVEHFEATTAAVGWCSSISGFCQSIVALFASYAIKSYGCRLPGVVGCLLHSLGLSLSYFAQNLTTIYFTYGVIAGSGAGIALLSTGIIIPQRFSRNRNLASGIGSIGYSCGGMIGFILPHYLTHMFSWRGAILVLAAIQAQRIPLCMFFRTPKTLTSQSNQASGINPRRIPGQMILRYLKETFNLSILCNARYSAYVIAYVLALFCLYGYYQHAVNRAIHAGLSRDQGVFAASLIGTCSTVMRLLVSFIANHPKVKSTLVFAIGMFFAFLSIVATFINPGIIGTISSTVLFGMHLGCTGTVFYVVAVDLVGLALLPKGLAILQFMGGFIKLLATPLIGWVFDLTRDYNKAFAIIGCSAFVSGSLMVALTFVTRCHRKPIVKDNEIPLTDNAVANP